MSGIIATILVLVFFWAIGVGLGYMIGQGAGRLAGLRDGYSNGWRDANIEIRRIIARSKDVAA